MRRNLLSVIAVPAVILTIFFSREPSIPKELPAPVHDSTIVIAGTVRPNDTLDSIFIRHSLDKTDLNKIYLSSKPQYDLSRISVGSVYSFMLDKDDRAIDSMEYGIDNTSYLAVYRKAGNFTAQTITMPITHRASAFSISINSSLMASMPGSHREYRRIALQIADIYAWDIDFLHDIRKGDSVNLIVDELWSGNAFRGYGNILAAEFVSGGDHHSAYMFMDNGIPEYFDENGRSLKKSLLRSPLKFKYISSGFSRRRLHPILRRYRPHLGIDYAAKRGTPVSAAGDGRVLYAGREGEMGKLVRIKQANGYER